MSLYIYQLLILTLSTKIIVSSRDEEILPPGLSIGVATSSYQIEGAWNLEGKGEGVWDRITHSRPWSIADRSNGDIAANSYFKYKEDVQLMKKMGLNHYRFSLSWPRILPTGFANKINHAGVKFYLDLIDELLANGIEPYVTIYHWDHPQSLEDLGGWTNELMVDWFVDYARVVFKILGPKVKKFVTVNEPNIFCPLEYGGQGPGKNFSLLGEYMCGHNVLKAHARVYHMYDKEFRAEQKGIIGLVLSCQYYFNLYNNDSESAETAFQFHCGWFANPLYSKDGDYPPIMRKRIDENSQAEGLSFSRLPKFSTEWIQYIRGSYDYFGLNHYTSSYAFPVKGNKTEPWYKDMGIGLKSDETWETGENPWLSVVPKGFGNVIRKISKDYGNVPIYIMENGISDNGTITYDTRRVNYLYTYMKEMIKAINDGCDVKCYTVWSLIDNFEWQQGYTEAFGMVRVDFNDPNRKRTPKYSYSWLSNVIRDGCLIPLQTQVINQV